MQEEVPYARGLYPWDIGSGASEDTGLILNCASDWTEAHDAMDLPAIMPHLAQQRATRVTLQEEKPQKR